MYILYDNYIEGSTITALTENPDYNFTTAFNDNRLSRVARTVADNSQTIDFDLLSSKSVSKLMIQDHNFSSGVSASLDAFVYNPLVDPRVMQLPLESDADDISGNDNNGTDADIIYTDKPDMKVYLPLATDSLDDSAFGNNGTATDVTFSGGVAVFNGTSSRILIPKYVNVNSFTVHFKFFIGSSIPSNMVLFTSVSSTFRSIALTLLTTGKIEIILSSNGSTGDIANFQSSINSVNLNSLNKITLTFDGSVYKLFVNNTEDRTYSNTNKLYVLTQSYLGVSRTGASAYFLGEMSNLFLIDRALTENERLNLENNNIFNPLPNPIAVFNGTTSEINCGNIANNITGYSFYFKFKRNGIPISSEILFVNYKDTNNRIRAFADMANGKIGVRNTDTSLSSNILYTNNNLCDNNWHDVVLNIISSTQIRFIVDGVEESIQTLTVPITTFVSPTFYIGAQVSSNFFTGELGNFCVFDRNISAAEISSLSTTGSYFTPEYTTPLTYNPIYIYKDLVTPQTYRYWRLSISDASNPDDYLEMSKVYLGSFISVYMDTAMVLDDDSNSSMTKSTSGQGYGNRQLQYKKAKFVLSDITPAKRSELRTFWQHVDIVKPFWMIIWEESLDVEPPIYLNLTKSLSWNKVAAEGGLWTVGIEVEEFF